MANLHDLLKKLQHKPKVWSVMVKEIHDSGNIFLARKHNHYLFAFSGHVARALSACVIYGVKIAGIKETLSKI